MAKKKTNCCGNFSVSMFWEEKLLLLVRTTTLLGFVYIAFYEQWPDVKNEYVEKGIWVMGFNFILFYKDYHELIVERKPHLYNLAAWLVALVIIALLGLCIGCAKKVRKELKHATAWLKRWMFNIMELMFLPVLANTVPYAACTQASTNNAFTLHECFKNDNKVYHYLF